MTSSSTGPRLVSGRMLRRTSRKGQLQKQNIPSLQEFMHRQTVLHQYREFLRTLRVVRVKQPDEYSNMYRQVATEFRQQQHATERLSIQMAVTNGARQLKQLQSMVGYSRGSGDASDSTKMLAEDDESTPAVDSWLGTHDPEDPRGRVGVQWPWQVSDEDNGSK